MRLLAILLAIQLLLPAVLLFSIQLYVDQDRVSDQSQVEVSYETAVQCSAARTALVDYSYPTSSLYLRLQNVLQRANTRDTYENLVSLSIESINRWDLVVTLSGVYDLTTLRCDLSVQSILDQQTTSYNLLVSTYVTLYPSSLLTPPPLPLNTDAHLIFGPGTSPTTAPTPSFEFGSTYMVYVLVIIIFLATLITTGAISCWLSIRVRNNRTRLQRAQVARIRELQDAITSAQESVVLTRMQMARSDNAPPPYEGAPVSTTISMHIDSAPPCYQEALAQPPGDTTDTTATTDPPPTFESISRSTSLESSTDETSQLINTPTEMSDRVCIQPSRLLASRQRGQATLTGLQLKSGCRIPSRMRPDGRLTGHQGCVNTVSWSAQGDLLLSGSDDCQLNIYQWNRRILLQSIPSGHTSNIFSAHFLPRSADREIVSCAGNGTIHLTYADRPDLFGYHPFYCNKGTCYEVAVSPWIPQEFYSCGEDGCVRLYDLRRKRKCLCRHNDCNEDVLVSLPEAASSLSVHPLHSCHFVVACADGGVREFDRRKLTPDRDTYVAMYKPCHLEDTKRKITCVRYSPDGHQLLVSYSADYLYLYNREPSQVTKNRIIRAEGPGFFWLCPINPSPQLE
ncbi:DDB1- and CUL4-associated factor 6-like [Oopsacas minuta]|uniref:DDB1- and CUL4-associated factor 6-like n=1 Tax=Oopsacas minuta TaxID=111878 RepID=A0AAV7K5U5_9METZ|nr:DDB1- and CUL4-associated factor 6-like [Oopsacas minuta]